SAVVADRPPESAGTVSGAGRGWAGTASPGAAADRHPGCAGTASDAAGRSSAGTGMGMGSPLRPPLAPLPALLQPRRPTSPEGTPSLAGSSLYEARRIASGCEAASDRSRPANTESHAADTA